MKTGKNVHQDLITESTFQWVVQCATYVVKYRRFLASSTKPPGVKHDGFNWDALLLPLNIKFDTLTKEKLERRLSFPSGNLYGTISRAQV